MIFLWVGLVLLPTKRILEDALLEVMILAGLGVGFLLDGGEQAGENAEAATPEGPERAAVLDASTRLEDLDPDTFGKYKM